MDLDDLPRPNGDAASKLSGEDLSPYSQDELGARIAMLEVEIARVTAHRNQAASHRLAADEFFKKSTS